MQVYISPSHSPSLSPPLFLSLSLSLSLSTFTLTQERKEESERKQREKLERDAEQTRLQREAKERENQRKNAELKELKRRKAEDRLETLKKTAVGARALADIKPEVRISTHCWLQRGASFSRTVMFVIQLLKLTEVIEVICMDQCILFTKSKHFR